MKSEKAVFMIKVNATFNKIREYNENQNAAIKQAQSGKPNSSTLVDSEGNVNKDQFKKLTNETLMNRNKS